MLHRGRQLLVRQRTMLSNAIRGHMAELGIVSAKGRHGTVELLKIIANAGDDRIPPAARPASTSRSAIRRPRQRSGFDKRIHAWHRSCEEAGGSRRSRALVRLSPRRWSPRLATGKQFPPVAI